MINLQNGSYRSLALSLLLHALLLVLLTMFVIKPMLEQRWYELELRPPNLPEKELSADSQPGTPQPQVGSAQAASNQPAEPKPQAPPAAKTAPKQNPEPAPPAKSELLETPAIAAPTPKPAALPSNPLNPLRNIPSRPGSAPARQNVQYSLSGGRVSFQIPQDYKHGLGAAGSVRVKFRLNQSAGLVPGSLESMEQTGPLYFEEAKKILQRGRFSFTGSPDPNAEYTMTLEFLL